MKTGKTKVAKTIRRMLACVLAVIALMTVMPFGGLTGLKASAEGINTNLYFDKLVSYINSYGIYSNGYKTIVNEKIDGNDTYFFAIQNKGNGIYFDLLTSSSASSYIAFNTEFVLYKTSKNISVDFLMLYYYNKRAVDSVSGVISIDRSTYTPNTKYTLNKKGAYITSTDATNSFNATLKLLCAYWDNYIYTNWRKSDLSIIPVAESPFVTLSRIIIRDILKYVIKQKLPAIPTDIQETLIARHAECK